LTALGLEKKEKTYRGDVLLIIAVVLLAVIGTVFIYSASNYSALVTYNDAFYFVKKQIIGIMIGVVAMGLTMYFPYAKLKKFNLPVAIISVVTLVLVFIPGIGVENKEENCG